jgi:hypothetical protein
VRRASLESFRESKERKRGELSCIKQTRTSGASAISFGNGDRNAEERT